MYSAGQAITGQRCPRLAFPKQLLADPRISLPFLKHDPIYTIGGAPNGGAEKPGKYHRQAHTHPREAEGVIHLLAAAAAAGGGGGGD
ncbi:hypothetical protein E2C01_037209 [Portunus trituberculatus]|uniref:Uncharacterized protein n=1 Tax=Portunus trituberculatus TaxID=210409 RepID=A0A5B7FEC8_PORTR|nr:hypothetical protein [Portunus trituberculatus]